MRHDIKIPPLAICVRGGPVAVTQRELDIIKLHVVRYPHLLRIVRANQERDLATCCFRNAAGKCVISPVRPDSCRCEGLEGKRPMQSEKRAVTAENRVYAPSNAWLLLNTEEW